MKRADRIALIERTLMQDTPITLIPADVKAIASRVARALAIAEREERNEFPDTVPGWIEETKRVLHIADERVREVTRTWWSTRAEHARTDKQIHDILHNVLGNHATTMTCLMALERRIEADRAAAVAEALGPVKALLAPKPGRNPEPEVDWLIPASALRDALPEETP